MTPDPEGGTLKKNVRRSMVLPLIAFAAALAAASCARPAPHVTFAGVRSSIYGLRPFPEPAAWEKAIQTMAGYYPGSTPVAVWIVGHLGRPRWPTIQTATGVDPG